jgi:pseudaminic acid cytidylyltransferase
MKAVAVIPARGGSTRIPRKNIKVFVGRPMISYPIEVLKRSGLFDRIIVSTDDEEIADIARLEGAEVPFMRPADLANDQIGTGPTIRHAIQWLEENDQRPEYVCCVYATTPFLRAEYLRQGWEAVRAGSRLAFSVTSFAYPIQRSFKLLESGGVEPFQPECIPCRSQDLTPAYHDAGQFYWGDAEAFLAPLSVFSEVSHPVILPRYLVQDIDDDEDWRRAELMFRALQAQVDEQS